MLADVILSMGRWHLRVAGFVLATEGDRCRDGSLPESVLPPIPPEELEHATIGIDPDGVLPGALTELRTSCGDIPDVFAALGDTDR